MKKSSMRAFPSVLRAGALQKLIFSASISFSTSSALARVYGNTKIYFKDTASEESDEMTFSVDSHSPPDNIEFRGYTFKFVTLCGSQDANGEPALCTFAVGISKDGTPLGFGSTSDDAPIWSTGIFNNLDAEQVSIVFAP